MSVKKFVDNAMAIYITKDVFKGTVLSKKKGLYTDNTGNPHFYYKGKKYAPGSLPRTTEIKLCKTQPFLRKYLEDYLPRYRKKISDPTEAGLTAILNYGKEYLFEQYENLSALEKTEPLKKVLVIDDEPLPEDNVYKQMNVRY